MPHAAPDFSVIIPTKDRPAMLNRAIRSVLAQHHKDFELIVADDGAGQGAALARSLIGEDAGFETGRLGQVPARSMALARAKGRWIAFLDDDDWWASPNHLAGMKSALGQGGLAYASGRIVRETVIDSPMIEHDVLRKPVPTFRYHALEPTTEIPFAAHIDPASIRRDNTLLISGIAYEAALHRSLGAFDESLPVYWDWDWYLRLAASGIRFTPSGGDGVRISARTDNVSSSGNEAFREAELRRLCAKHGLVGVVLKNHESIAIEQQRRPESLQD